MKIYRPRNTSFKQLVKALSHLLVEKKRGISARARFETERAALETWAREGFSVPQILDLPRPELTGNAPFLWLEFLPGVPLSDFIENSSTPLDQKTQYVERLATSISQRHGRALANQDPLLIPEHASIKHVIVDKDRMTHFDLEGAYRSGFSVKEAATQEISGTLRSLARKGEQHLTEYLDAFLRGYTDRAQLLQLLTHGLECRSIYRYYKRKHDRKKRQRFSKTDMLQTLRDRLTSS